MTIKTFCLKCFRYNRTRRMMLSRARCPGCGSGARMLFLAEEEVDVLGILGALFRHHFGDELPRKKEVRM